MGSLVVSRFAEHYILLFRCAFFAACILSYVCSSKTSEFYAKVLK